VTFVVSLRAVPALARGDAERLLRFVAEAESFGDDHPFSGEFLTQLGRLIPADWVGYDELLLGPGYGPAGLEFVRPEDEGRYDGFDFAAVMPVILAECPLCQYIRQERFAAVKFSDGVSRREFCRTLTYKLLFEPLGLRDSLELRLRTGPGRWIAKLAFDRNGRDFTARDRIILDALKPHLMQLLRTAETRSRLRAALALHESTGAAVVLLEAHGRVEFASSAARELLERYFGDSGAQLPAPLATWLRERRRGATSEPLRVDVGDRLLRVEPVDGALLLEEQRRLPRLTAREREILDLVAEGRSNVEIAERLWVSPLTVRKHLENIFAKLGVHTRTAAAALFRERPPHPVDHSG
jgi:DNA-binding CsgD family transcriptional regulator